MQLAVLQDEKPGFFSQVDKYINSKDAAGLKIFLEESRQFHECLDDTCMKNLFEYSRWPGNDDIKKILENKLIRLLGKRLNPDMFYNILQLAVTIDSPEVIKLAAEKTSLKKP